MHLDNVVVAIRDAKTRNTFREFQTDKPDQGFAARYRERNLVLPFDTEYEFFVKVQDNVRRRLEISIDGSDFDLIVSPGETVIERWTDSAHRFKFVRATDAAVTNPSSPSNGQVSVRVHAEIAPCFQPVFIYPPAAEWPWPQKFYEEGNEPWVWPVDHTPWWKQLPYSGDPTPQYPIWGSTPKSDPAQDWVRDAMLGGATCNQQQYHQMNAAYSMAEPGATVEGSKSAQQFCRSSWRGDEAGCYEFVWRMSGRQGPRPGHCVECDTLLHTTAKFCHACGKRIILSAG